MLFTSSQSIRLADSRCKLKSVANPDVTEWAASNMSNGIGAMDYNGEICSYGHCLAIGRELGNRDLGEDAWPLKQ